MNKASSIFGVLLILAALGYGGYWYYTKYQASAGMSGKTFYETCWEYKSKMAGFNEPKPSNPYQAAQWKNCETVTLRGIYAEGMIFVGKELGEDFDRLRKACPDVWSEIPLAGNFYLYVEDTEKAGGLSTLSRL